MDPSLLPTESHTRQDGSCSNAHRTQSVLVRVLREYLYSGWWWPDCFPECVPKPPTGESRVVHLAHSFPTFVGQTSLGFGLYDAEQFLDEAANCCPATASRNLFPRRGRWLIVYFGANLMPLIHVTRCNLRYGRGLNGHSLWAILVVLMYACGLASCGDTDNVSPPASGPGPLAIVTNSSLPTGTVNQPYATA
jgi:hypothetical protein